VVEVIEYLKEIEVRGLHFARGYSSMFAFATDFLRYSDAEAHIRIQAARLTSALPEVSEKIRSGELSLSVAAMAHSQFRKENLRRKEKGQITLSAQEKHEALELLAGSSRREAEQSLNSHFAQPSMRSLTFRAGPELLEKIEKLMNLMAHKNFDRDLGKMVEILVETELKQYAKKNGQAQSSEKDLETEDDHGIQKPGPGQSVNKHLLEPIETEPLFRLQDRNRYIPRKTRTFVWTKYEGKCNYKDPLTGRKCGSKHGVQIDHRLALAKGGDHRPGNLTLLCSGHNVWKGARQVE
jgi:hypothetical protein